MKKTITIILALISITAYCQRTEERATIIQAPKGITIGGEKVDSITFHGSDSITFYSGANSVVAGGTGTLSGSNDSIYFESFGAWYAGNDTIPDDSLRSFVNTYLVDSGIPTRIYAGDTSNYPTPDAIGQDFIDTSAREVYKAIGTTRGDWVKLNSIWLFACFFRVRLRKNKKV